MIEVEIYVLDWQARYVWERTSWDEKGDDERCSRSMRASVSIEGHFPSCSTSSSGTLWYLSFPGLTGWVMRKTVIGWGFI